jgi:hypothetical protein
MKKIFVLLASLFLLVGCIESMALLGPATSVLGGGKVVQSSVSSAINYGVKKQTGKSPMQHALAYAEEKNPNREKKRCISFIKKTNSEVCAIAKKQVGLTKANVKKKTKSFFKKTSLTKKDITTETENKIAITSRGQAFADARKKGKDSFVFEGKIYSTKFKEEDAEKIINPFSKNYVFANRKNKNEDQTKNKKSIMEIALDIQTALNNRN